MTFSNIAKRFGKLTADNSPAILTAIGVTGCITTAVLTGKASMKAQDILVDAYHEKNTEAGFGGNGPGDWESLELREKIDLTWQLYIPAVGMGTLTIACIIAANRIGTRRAAAMAAAYTMGEKAFSEYKEKVVEKLGETKEQKVRDEIAQDHVNENPPVESEILRTGGDQLCYEEFTGRYFYSTMEKLKKAQNDTNYKVLNSYYASIGDFYDNAGLQSTPMSEEFGWNSDKMMELTFHGTLIDGVPCMVVGYAVVPIRNYYRVC